MNISITNTSMILNQFTLVSSNKGSIIEYLGTLTNLIFSSNIISNNTLNCSNIALSTASLIHF